MNSPFGQSLAIVAVLSIGCNESGASDSATESETSDPETAAGASDSGTEPMDPSFPVRYATESLALGTSFDAPVCDGNLSLLDAQVRWLAEELLAAPELPLWVYLYRDDEPEAIADACMRPGETNLAGCWNGTAHGPWDALSHELGHAVAEATQQRPVSFLAEGIATMMSGTIAEAYASEREKVDDLLTMSASEFGCPPIRPLPTSRAGSERNSG